MKKKISIYVSPLISSVGLDRALEIVAESGFDGIDFDLSVGTPNFKGSHAVHDVDEEYLLKVKSKADSLGLAIPQTHGDCSSNLWLPENKDLFILTHERELRAAAILGAKACIIHSAEERPCGPLDPDPELLHRINLEGYTSLIPYAEKYDVKMALESFGRNKREGIQFFAWPQEIAKSMDSIPTKCKTFCLDTGHVHEAEELGLTNVGDFIRYMGARTEYLHLHDNFGYYDDHALPGIGNINWPDVFKALDEIGFNGYYNFELGYGQMGCMSEEFIRFCGKYLRKFIDLNGDLSLE